MQGTKSKHSPNKSSQISSYFSAAEKKDRAAQKQAESHKMATAANVREAAMDYEAAAGSDLSQILARFDKLEGELLLKINGMIQPLSDRLDQMNLNLQSVSKVAESANARSLAQGEELQSLRNTCTSITEQTAILNNRSRYFNLKFRGLAELSDEQVDLSSYISSWLASELNLGEGVEIAITQAYRLGRQHNPKRTLPRDVIATFFDIRVKKTILALAKEKGHLQHLTDQVQVYPDLAPEALDKKKELKEIIAVLRDRNIRFRWASPIKLQIFYRMKSYFVTSEEEGIDLLQALNLPKPPCPERQPSKRKLYEPVTPQKDPKVRN